MAVGLPYHYGLGAGADGVSFLVLTILGTWLSRQPAVMSRQLASAGRPMHQER
jgi:hypothetical protein